MVYDLKKKMCRRGKATKTEYRLGIVVMSHAWQVAVLDLRAGEPDTTIHHQVYLQSPEVHWENTGKYH